MTNKFEKRLSKSERVEIYLIMRTGTEFEPKIDKRKRGIRFQSHASFTINVSQVATELQRDLHLQPYTSSAIPNPISPLGYPRV